MCISLKSGSLALCAHALLNKVVCKTIHITTRSVFSFTRLMSLFRKAAMITLRLRCLGTRMEFTTSIAMMHWAQWYLVAKTRKSQFWASVRCDTSLTDVCIPVYYNIHNSHITTFTPSPNLPTLPHFSHSPHSLTPTLPTLLTLSHTPTLLTLAQWGLMLSSVESNPSAPCNKTLDSIKGSRKPGNSFISSTSSEKFIYESLYPCPARIFAWTGTNVRQPCPHTSPHPLWNLKIMRSYAVSLENPSKFCLHRGLSTETPVYVTKASKKSAKVFVRGWGALKIDSFGQCTGFWSRHLLLFLAFQNVMPRPNGFDHLCFCFMCLQRSIHFDTERVHIQQLLLSCSASSRRLTSHLVLHARQPPVSSQWIDGVIMNANFYVDGMQPSLHWSFPCSVYTLWSFLWCFHW